MTQEEIIAVIEKLRYHVSVLGQAIDVDAHPVESLIVSMDWSREDLNRVHDIFEKWDNELEAGEEMNSGEFEGDFQHEFGINYQGLKPIILAFYRNYQWTNVCEAYVDSFGERASVEFHTIVNRQR